MIHNLCMQSVGVSDVYSFISFVGVPASALGILCLVFINKLSISTEFK